MVVLEHQALAKKGAALVELRLDWLSRPPDVVRLLEQRPTPVVVTCRRQSDRGRWRGSEEQRQAILRTAIASGAEYIDLESEIAGSIPRFGDTKRIVSHHDFDETPENLEEIYARLKTLDPDVIKLVTMANTPADSVRLLKLVSESDVPTVGFCMGELGLTSRLLCGKYGSPFTFATFNKDRELAPGQLSFDEMRDVYQFEKINSNTQVFGVLGDPIAHSMSPLLHNLAFQDQKLDAVYLPMRVPPGMLTRTLEAFEWLGVRGYSVTIPHKEAVLEITDRFVGPVRGIGAANTLYRDAQDRWSAANTDHEAAMECIRIALGEPADKTDFLKGKMVLMLGAGGVARAIAYGLLRAGAVLSITNRSEQRGVELAAAMQCQHVKWANRVRSLADIIVNCTSVGMHPDLDETPYQMNWITEGQLVFDTVYNPENTLLLKDAREYGWQTASGLDMFVRQAAAQFELFTGRRAPLDRFQDAVRREISAVNRS